MILTFYSVDVLFIFTDTSIFLRVLFSKPTFSEQVLILWINLQTFLPLGRGRVDERSSPSSNNGVSSNEGPNGPSNQIFSCSPDPQTNRTIDYVSYSYYFYSSSENIQFVSITLIVIESCLRDL